MPPLGNSAQPASVGYAAPSGPQAEIARGEAPGRRTYPRGSRARYFGALVGLALLYVIGYGWLLASTDALPYTIDNSESFAAFLHGANMFRFGVATSFGLTDEAFSPDAAAHPYVYTHGGNFPRLYTYLLYALGARTQQAQIVIATFTVGALGLLLLYAYFARVAGIVFAALACVVFGTDYLYFAQWQVSTYRVWHTFFLFAALLCAHGVGERRRRLFLVLTFVTEACLVYFDLTFALFVSVFVGVYAAFLYRRQPGVLARTWATQFVAAAAALALMVAQSVAYLGWSGFAFDVNQVYAARNNPLAGTGAGDPPLLRFATSTPVTTWCSGISSGLTRPCATRPTPFMSSSPTPCSRSPHSSA